MDQYMKLLKNHIMLVILLIVSPVLIADQGAEESKLIKSWGLELTEQGLLRFRSDQKQADFSPWQPNFQPAQVLLSDTSDNTEIDPLIISSKPFSSIKSDLEK